MTAFIPLSLAEVSSEYLTTAFRESGLLRRGEVVGFDTRVVGEGAGFLGEIVDVQLSFSPGSEDAPKNVILKIPTAMKNRQIGQTLGVYEREIRFYRELRPLLPIRTPEHYFSAMDVTTDPAQALKSLAFLDKMPLWVIRLLMPLMNWVNSKSTWHYVLMIEHLGDYRIGDQVGGCTFDEAKRAITAMAEMHAAFWDSDRFADFPWLVPMKYAEKPVQVMFLGGLEQFIDVHGSRLTRAQQDLVYWLRDNFFTLMKVFSESPPTLIHGDFRLDNLCFDDERNDVILFDWQTLGVGSGAGDLAYFLSALPVEVSDEQVSELVDYYSDQLQEHGIRVSRELVHWQYKLGLLGVLHRLVPAEFQDMLQMDGRGSDLITTWLDRVLVRLHGIDPDELLARPPSS